MLGEEYETAINSIKDFDHGLLSAFEFLTYLKNDVGIYDKYKSVITDIAYHTTWGKTPISSENKTLILLILCDEIQDWGRPNNYNQIPISKIDPFIIGDNELTCNFVIDDLKK